VALAQLKDLGKDDSAHQVSLEALARLAWSDDDVRQYVADNQGVKYITQVGGPGVRARGGCAHAAAAPGRARAGRGGSQLATPSGRAQRLHGQGVAQPGGRLARGSPPAPPTPLPRR
jgi:hypothetical protein